MILQQMIETVQQLFPSVGQTEGTILLNQYMNEFYSDTRVMRGYADVTLTGAVSYACPVTIEVITGLSVLDAGGLVIKGDIYLTIDDTKAIAFTDADGNKVAVEPIGAAILRVAGVLAPTALSALTSVPSCPSQFHGAPLARLIEVKAAMAERMPLAAYWRDEYKTLVHKAKMYGNTHGDATPYTLTVDSY
jgi:hypothetical protein